MDTLRDLDECAGGEGARVTGQGVEDWEKKMEAMMVEGHSDGENDSSCDEDAS